MRVNYRDLRRKYIIDAVARSPLAHNIAIDQQQAGRRLAIFISSRRRSCMIWRDDVAIIRKSVIGAVACLSHEADKGRVCTFVGSFRVGAMIMKEMYQWLSMLKGDAVINGDDNRRAAA